MSDKRYTGNCLYCGKAFTARMSHAKFCSNNCRAKYSQAKSRGVIKSQAETIKTQSKVIQYITSPKFEKFLASIPEQYREQYKEYYSLLPEYIRLLKKKIKDIQDN